MDKTLNMAGQRVTFSAPDGDQYLQTMSLDGPVDLRPIFNVFCEKGSNVIDVGANIGVTAILAGLLVAPGKVLAIEPVPETFEHLERNVRGSGLTNVKCLKAAAASVHGEVGLVARPGFNFAAFVGDGTEGVGYRNYPARAETLDQRIADEGLHQVDFLKIDVEGYELEVLRGAGQVLDTFKPIVLMEANHYCLNIFRRTSLVDFVEEVLSIFPRVYAVDSSFNFLDLTSKANHQSFFHENVVNQGFFNLVCGFTPTVEEGLSRVEGESLVRPSAAPNAGHAELDLPSSNRGSRWRRATRAATRRLRRSVH